MRVDTPQKDTCWRHTNGNTYVVLHIANQPDDAAPSERYPLMVVYQGANGKVWSRRADDWHRSMTEITPEELR